MYKRVIKGFLKSNESQSGSDLRDDGVNVSTKTEFMMQENAIKRNYGIFVNIFIYKYTLNLIYTN